MPTTTTLSHPVDIEDSDEFTLDFQVIESDYPLAKLSCDTDDGCGQTCSTSACNSQANNPA